MNRQLLGVVAGALGIALAWAGVTGRDPRADVIAVLRGRPLPGATSSSGGTATTGTVAGATPAIVQIGAALGAAGLLRAGRVCGVDTLAGEATSEHVGCNAKDLMVTSTADGDRIATWLAARIGTLPIHCVIWNRRIISREQRTAGWRPYSGANPHTDHVHVSGWPSVYGGC